MLPDFSMAYLTAASFTAPQAVDVAAEVGYQQVGLRLLPNGAGGPFQALLDAPEIFRETLAHLKDTGVQVYDLEIVRIGDAFDPDDYLPLFDAGQRLGAKAVLVAGDDPDLARLADHYGRLCETMHRFNLTADLEFMPWTAVCDATTALSVVRAAGMPPNAGILVDGIHFGRSHTSLDDIAALPKSLLHYAQLCDATPGTGFTEAELIHTARVERLLPGEGGIDLVGLFSALPRTLPVSVEVPNALRMPLVGPKAWARQCLEASRAFIAALPPA
ncbi:MAG: xylose isomerase [Rhodoferax sp.]|nr:xylose isomerase [Rhodoferax sp.]